MKLESIVHFLDRLLEVSDFPDYGSAHNGLQVEGPERISRVAAAVDLSEETIAGARQAGADLLVVHHGLFWGGITPLTGRRFRKVAALVCHEIALYSAHLPLDAHPEVGNCAVLCRELGIPLEERFGRYEDRAIGWIGEVETGRALLRQRLADVVGTEVRVVAGGPEEIGRVAVVTGSGGSFIEEAARAGADALITGEGSHHDYVEATELGLNVFYGGHYATETWGVRALAARLEDRFGIPWTFVDAPSGL